MSLFCIQMHPLLQPQQVEKTRTGILGTRSHLFPIVFHLHEGIVTAMSPWP